MDGPAPEVPGRGRITRVIALLGSTEVSAPVVTPRWARNPTTTQRLPIRRNHCRCGGQRARHWGQRNGRRTDGASRAPTMAAGAGTVVTGAGPGRQSDGAIGRRPVVIPSETMGRPGVGAELPPADDSGRRIKRQSGGDRGGDARIRHRALDEVEKPLTAPGRHSAMTSTTITSTVTTSTRVRSTPSVT
jgi:hypothetical protein